MSGEGRERVESELELAGRIMNPFHLDDGAVEREKMSLPPPPPSIPLDQWFLE